MGGLPLRYRPYYKRNQPSQTKSDEKGHEFTMLFAYNFLKSYSAEYELNYKKSEDEILSNNEKEEWAHDLKIAYKWNKNWVPYAAIGNIPGSKTTDERQTRYRIGVQYIW